MNENLLNSASTIVVSSKFGTKLEFYTLFLLRISQYTTTINCNILNEKI